MIIIKIIETAAFVYVLLITIRAFMTWFNSQVLYTYRKFFEIVSKLVDPFLLFVRRFFPVNVGRVDFSPVIAIILVEVAKRILLYLIVMLIKGNAA